MKTTLPPQVAKVLARAIGHLQAVYCIECGEKIADGKREANLLPRGKSLRSLRCDECQTGHIARLFMEKQELMEKFQKQFPSVLFRNPPFIRKVR